MAVAKPMTPRELSVVTALAQQYSFHMTPTKTILCHNRSTGRWGVLKWAAREQYDIVNRPHVIAFLQEVAGGLTELPLIRYPLGTFAEEVAGRWVLRVPDGPDIDLFAAEEGEQLDLAVCLPRTQFLSEGPRMARWERLIAVVGEEEVIYPAQARSETSQMVIHCSLGSRLEAMLLVGLSSIGAITTPYVIKVGIYRDRQGALHIEEPEADQHEFAIAKVGHRQHVYRILTST